MACCALEGCDDPSCPVCASHVRFPPIVRCGKPAGKKGTPCRLVAGHPPPCDPERGERVERAELKD